MGKSIHNNVFDASLDYLANNAAVLVACSAEPLNYTEAISTYALADVAIDNADFTKADGDVSGRKTTIAAQDGVNVDTTGDATHVAICSADTLLLVTTCTTQTLTSGNQVNFPAFDWEITDPS